VVLVAVLGRSRRFKPLLFGYGLIAVVLESPDQPDGLRVSNPGSSRVPRMVSTPPVTRRGPIAADTLGRVGTQLHRSAGGPRTMDGTSPNRRDHRASTSPDEEFVEHAGARRPADTKRGRRST
jgi:hypothetical protein